MKRFPLFLTLFATMLLASVSLTSCSDDEPPYDNYVYLGNTVWQGDMYSTVTYDEVQYNATSSLIGFYSEYNEDATYGYGYWIDFYNNDNVWGSNYVASHIQWDSDRYGNVKVYFEEDDYTIYLDNCVMYSDGYLDGYLEDGNFYKMFELQYTVAPNWSAYFE